MLEAEKCKAERKKLRRALILAVWWEAVPAGKEVAQGKEGANAKG